jgi:hypothetical protein
MVCSWPEWLAHLLMEMLIQYDSSNRSGDILQRYFIKMWSLARNTRQGCMCTVCWVSAQCIVVEVSSISLLGD